MSSSRALFLNLLEISVLVFVLAPDIVVLYYLCFVPSSSAGSFLAVYLYLFWKNFGDHART